MLLAEEFEEDIKKIKDTVYRLSWYMRGGLSVDTLLYNTDVMDQDVISKIIKDNIERIYGKDGYDITYPSFDEPEKHPDGWVKISSK